MPGHPQWSYKGVDGSEVEFTLWDTKVVDVVGLTFKGLVCVCVCFSSIVLWSLLFFKFLCSLGPRWRK